MWIFTQHGFASIVEHRFDPTSVMVRGRDRADIERLADLVPDRPQIVDTPDADYPHRFVLPKTELAVLLTRLAVGIRYCNFKDRVKEVNPGREVVYSRVWATMLAIEAPRPRNDPSQFALFDDVGDGADYNLCPECYAYNEGPWYDTPSGTFCASCAGVAPEFRR